MSTQASDTEKQAFDEIVKSLKISVKTHRTWVDGWLYNGGTVATLFLTAAVSVISGKVFEPGTFGQWLPSVLSACAGLFIALERSLGFGPRWRFHTEMKAGYITVIDMIKFYFVIPEDDKEQRFKLRAEIWQSLNALRSRESAIPNSGGAVTGGSGV